MKALRETYAGLNVLVTGHTGFKGSWLSLWLDTLGAKVSALALPPHTTPNHWDQLQLRANEARADIRDATRVREALAGYKPEIVFHLAAQALVRRSYVDPLATWSSNVMGTANLLDACRGLPSVRAIVVITTDKCYENREWGWGYREIDPLGGHDPYSASKAAAEIVALSYRRSFFARTHGPLLATARAGNVIGGGDWSEDRLIPDAARAFLAGSTLLVRAPHAVRPWQHVLDSLYGYLLLGQRLLQGDQSCADAWNFGPEGSDAHSVSEVLDSMREHWPQLRWQVANGDHPHETHQLRLDSSKARQQLGWQPIWDFRRSVQTTTEWYRRFIERGEIASRLQLEQYQRALDCSCS